MAAVNHVFDTNVLLYHVSGRLEVPLPESGAAVSVITEIELLSYNALSGVQEQGIREALTFVSIIGLSDSVKEQAIAVRRNSRLRLPDAVIVATAMTLGAELWTNDVRLHSVKGLRVRAVTPKPAT